MDLREDVLCVGQEEIKLSMAKTTGSTNHSIKWVALVEEKFNKSGQEEPSLLPAEMEEELAEEVQIRITTKEEIGKPTRWTPNLTLTVDKLLSTL